MKNLTILALGLSMMFGSCHKTTAKEERTLKSNIFREPGTLDPRRQSDLTSEALLRMLFEGLTRVNPDMTVEPAQAESIDISTDRKIYTFHLGPCKWSDGTSVTAYDYAQTWLDLLDPGFPAPNAHLLTPIKNAMPAKRGEVPLSEVGIKAIDDRTLRIELSAPFPAFLHIAANDYLAPICHRVEERHPKWATEPEHHISNGPFRLAEWKNGLEIKLVRNPAYRGKAPKLDAVMFTIINNDSAALHMYASGNLDLIGTTISPIPLSYLKDLKERNALYTTKVAATYFVSFNVHRFPFNNVNIRKAFATAINRRSIIEHITQLDEEPALGAIPPVLKKGRVVNWISDGDSSLARQYLEQGLQELNISKHALDGLTLIYWPWEIPHKVSQALQQQWLDTLGIHVNIESKEAKTVYAAAAERTYQMGIFGWQADYCDVSAILERFRYEDELKNYPHWNNPKFVELLDASSNEPDLDKRLDILEMAEKVLIDDMPIAPIFHTTFAYMIQPKVKGFVTNALGQIYFDEISISK
jgi:oligopeptide transport system substrate-binding protein